MTDDAVKVAVDVLTIERDGLTALSDAVGGAKTALNRAFKAAFDTVKSAKGRLVVTGMGKSGHIGNKMAATFASTGTPSFFVHPAEASHGDLGMIGNDDVVLALSNSGETRELGDILVFCGRFDIPLIAITSKADSALGRAADIVLELPPAPEACAETRAPTTSTTLALALGDALAVALLRDKGFGKDDFGIYHPGGKLGASLKKVREMVPADRPLPLVQETTTMADTVEVLNAGGFGCVGVTGPDGELVGIITDGDIRRRLSIGVMEKTATDAMTKGPKVVTPDTLAAEALGILAKTKITALFVVEGATPVGLLHVHDCLQTGVV